jgi:hypothetical protein
VLEPELAQELGHLRDVAEHVRQVPDLHPAAEPSGHGQPVLQVAHEGLAGDEELVGQGVPRPHRHPAARGEGSQARLGLGPHRQVVVHHRHLAVEHEVGVGGITLQLGQQSVEEVDEAQPERLERGVPLAVPVRVGDDVDASDHAARYSAAAAHDAG